MDLVKVMAEGTMRASVLQAEHKGITIDVDKAVIKMREIMKAEWEEFNQTIKDALEANMGDAMLKQIMNTYCNSWAVKSIN